MSWTDTSGLVERVLWTQHGEGAGEIEIRCTGRVDFGVAHAFGSLDITLDSWGPSGAKGRLVVTLPGPEWGHIAFYGEKDRIYVVVAADPYADPVDVESAASCTRELSPLDYLRRVR